LLEENYLSKSDADVWGYFSRSWGKKFMTRS
jgi:hypothetical protein